MVGAHLSSLSSGPRCKQRRSVAAPYSLRKSEVNSNCSSLDFISTKMNEDQLFLPSSLNELLPLSNIFPHHPEVQGIASTPWIPSKAEALNLNGSLQLPRSPRERHLKHLLNAPG